jgi:hypothetical protein
MVTATLKYDDNRLVLSKEAEKQIVVFPTAVSSPPRFATVSAM